MGMNHVALGMLLPFLAFVAAAAAGKGRRGVFLFWITPLMMTLLGVWAVLPDLPRFLGWHDLYLRLAADPRCDLFFWHHTIDQIEADRAIYGLAVVAMGLAPLAAACRELKRREARAWPTR